ncbi:alginate O-acetyltransferase AlgF [Hahella ganghwensis]|uniref:alginate O-acetyltransferase AlgF n=1 Tax=Hahella ganghwensis TaxID=286420 RepID=UPI00037AF945|nr:alginate O-acetyltransferase AlgF [Hahella ganghwensis]
MKTYVKNILLIFLVWSFATSLARADEAALYGPEAPPGSAFIRVFNAQVNLPVENAGVGGKVFGEIDPLSSSKYVFLPAGAYEVELSGAKQPVQLEKDAFYTLVVLKGEEPKLVQDEAFDNRRKALLGLYNLTDADALDLKTSNGKTAVLESVEKLGSKHRQVNAVKISLAAFNGSEKLADAAPVNLERGKVFSLFACGSKAQPRLVWVESQVDSQI